MAGALLATGRLVQLPSLVRMKPGALARLGVYVARLGLSRVELCAGDGLPAPLLDAVCAALGPRLVTRDGEALVAFGGGRAMDEAKQQAAARALPWLAVPTSLSQDGFASPFASVTEGGARRTVRGAMPAGVVVDTSVCLQAPRGLWLAGLGDACAKLSAVLDWKLAFHATGEPVDDLAALLSDATVHQVLARPTFDDDGLRLLGTALFLNGVAMELAGSSRPASGSEHLLSHALDARLAAPRAHGLQVALMSLVSLRLLAVTVPARRDGGDPTRLGAQAREALARLEALGEATGLWAACAAQPLGRDEVLAAVADAPALRPEQYTVLSTRDTRDEVAAMLREDPVLRRCTA